MNRRRGPALGAVLLTAGSLLAGCSGASPGMATLDHAAPDWSGTTVSGAHLDSRAFRGDWVVLNFFASWCIPCQQETPQLVAFAAGPAPARRARIVGVLYSDTANHARRFATAHRMGWPILDDTSGRLASEYDLRGLPESYIIDPSGRLVQEIFGGVTVAKLDAVIPAT